MSGIEKQVEVYLHDIFGIETIISVWADIGCLPLFLRDRYQFFVSDILGTACLYIVDSSIEICTAGTVRKHIERIEALWDGAIILVRERIVAYDRKRLVECGVPFIVPGNQMYLFPLGLDFRN